MLAVVATAQAQVVPATEAEPLRECEVIARANSEVILACELEWQVRLMFQQRFGPDAAKVTESPLFAAAREELLKQLTISRLEIALLYADFAATHRMPTSPRSRSSSTPHSPTPRYPG